MYGSVWDIGLHTAYKLLINNGKIMGKGYIIGMTHIGGQS